MLPSGVNMKRMRPVGECEEGSKQRGGSKLGKWTIQVKEDGSSNLRVKPRNQISVEETSESEA